MRKLTFGLTVVAALAVLALLDQSVRAATPAATTISVPDMHCMGCAKKMAARLYRVPGVSAVQASVPATTLTILPQAQQVLSARALWEAVEQAGYKPSKLKGPTGTFTAKPQS